MNTIYFTCQTEYFKPSTYKLKTIKEWLIQLNGASGLGDQYEATLLGYSSEGIEKF